ncbi:methyltransferase [Micromonospora sp. ATCC 39149]|uniref:methyltransferase domain-containing protein n=1 Tax=Micromonospora sp. (strain ATCC 39149 / NRRL 15099 / SCC 1413) TaxID=219305 RepID=UPI0001A506D5|nr:methyltransferase domain-containing protein [Micromonospora sp. ATCC 39149]EEP75214.1 methyltransferase [Micromonospora sp. ATCC 39149]
MTGGGAAAAAWEANSRCYGDGRATLAYVDDPYHAVRRRLIGAALLDAVDDLDAGDGPGGPAGALLELGAGARSIFDSLPGLRRPTVVADLSWPALTELTAGRHRPVRLDVTRPLPLADRSVAGVVAAELIEHLYHPGALLAEIARVLRPGGALVLSTPNLATLQDRIRFLLGRSPRQVDPMHRYLHLHIRPFTAQMLRRILRAAGFVDVSIRSNYVGVHVGRGRWLQSRLLARLFPGLGGSLVASARRPW